MYICGILDQDIAELSFTDIPQINYLHELTSVYHIYEVFLDVFKDKIVLSEL